MLIFFSPFYRAKIGSFTFPTITAKAKDALHILRKEKYVACLWKLSTQRQNACSAICIC